ncbi:MAG: hemerythrin family protein [Polyangiaceae bacterium]|nr:hemerythrin family protein [Polyangiaceae bacterium]
MSGIILPAGGRVTGIILRGAAREAWPNSRIGRRLRSWLTRRIVCIRDFDLGGGAHPPRRDMSLIPWDERYLVRVPEIDEQHRRLVGMINDFYDAVAAGTAHAAVGELLRGMVEYTKYHFTTEERLMRLHAAPDMAAHLAAHRHFTAKANDVAARHARGALVVSLEITNFLRSGLTDHILTMYKDLGAFIATRMTGGD